MKKQFYITHASYLNYFEQSSIKRVFSSHVIIPVRNLQGRYPPSQQILVPRTPRRRSSPTYPGRTKKILFGYPGDVSL